MTTWFITRHPGALAWAIRQGLHIDRHVSHLDPAEITAGDTVIGMAKATLDAVTLVGAMPVMVGAIDGDAGTSETLVETPVMNPLPLTVTAVAKGRG